MTGKLGKSTEGILVIGGSGFVGSHLLSFLAKTDVELFNMDLMENTSNNAVKYLHQDIRLPICHEFKHNPDVVILLAATHRTPGHSPDEYYETNVRGAINVINWCLEKNVKRIVFVSSIAVYGPSNLEKCESSSTNPASDYGRSKLIAEDLFKIWQLKNKSNSLTVIRPGVVFGKGERGNFSRMAKALRQGWFVIPSDASVFKSAAYVKDLVACIGFTMKRMNAVQTYNFAFPKAYAVDEICEMMQKIGDFHKPRRLPLDFISNQLASLPVLSTLGLRIRKLYSQTLVSTSNLEEIDFKWEFDLDSALVDWYSVSKFDLEPVVQGTQIEKRLKRKISFKF